MSSEPSTSGRIAIDVTAREDLHACIRRASSHPDVDRDVRERCVEALKNAHARGVDYDVVFDACDALRAIGDGENVPSVRAVLTLANIRFEVVREREELTEEEKEARRAHRELMATLRDVVEARAFAKMTCDVDRTRGSDRSSPMGFKADTRAFGFAAHVLTVMFAFACAGYVGGGALERSGANPAWARGLCAALGAALGLTVEAGLMILREGRV